ncbi:MAG: hypothetical protein GY803_32375 [Chloroflexi bacterium]|nr:hypothetical protein [Chloroflexota bacterium]
MSAEEIAALQITQALLQTTTKREHCPEPEQLLRFESGLMPKKERSEIQTHCADCDRCQAEIQKLSQAGALEWAPQPLPAIAERFQSAGKRTLEAVFMPAPQLTLAFRGERETEKTYQAGDYRVIISQKLSGDATDERQIEGQLLKDDLPPENAETFRIQFWRSTTLVAEQPLDPFGLFQSLLLKPGNYELRLELPSEIILIDSYEVA